MGRNVNVFNGYVGRTFSFKDTLYGATVMSPGSVLIRTNQHDAKRQENTAHYHFDLWGTNPQVTIYVQCWK